jgi:hypothetical protein
VLEATDGARTANLAMVRGDAYRLAGHEREARQAYAVAAQGGLPERRQRPRGFASAGETPDGETATTDEGATASADEGATASAHHAGLEAAADGTDDVTGTEVAPGTAGGQTDDTTRPVDDADTEPGT